MKAVSIKHPWAELIAQGLKTIEVRTWQTSHRGELLICSSLKPDPQFDLSDENLKYGYALAVVDLVKVTRFTNQHEQRACCDYFPGAYAWHLNNVRLIEPFRVKGQQGLFNINEAMLNEKLNIKLT